jgi:ribosomal protein S12 methylthiotransferase
MQQVYIESLGCARNQVDSEIMAARLHAAHMVLTDDPARADAIVVNTCSFIESAADESIDAILTLARYKRQGRCRCLVVTGCLTQRYGSDSLEALPEVDVFLGTGAYDKIVDALSRGVPAHTCLLPDPDGIDMQTPVFRKPFSAHAAYLKIAEGCSRRCTYCIIPRLRGRHKSRPLETLTTEARALIRGGVKELTLVAQESTAYGSDLVPPADFATLLEHLALLDPGVWIRFLYGHPASLGADVIGAVARHENVCSYFDIPIQHASDRMLRRMGRHYRGDDLLRLFEQIRTVIPEAVLRTTLLVGFPGETDDDFEQLVHFINGVGFDHLGVFTYSDGEDLAAHRLNDPVDAQTAQERQEALMAVQLDISARRLSRYRGQCLTVLVESRPEPGLYVGRSAFQAPEVDGTILLRYTGELAIGTFIPVRITDALDYDLIGAPL